MTASRIAWYSAVATGVVWAAKALAIWEAGGLDKTNLEDVGWALGVLLFLVTWAALGYALAEGRAFWLRIVAGLVGVVIGLVVVLVLDGAADVLPKSTGWVKEEAGLWTAAIVTLAVAWIQRRRAVPVT
jgi:hypothetical protein